MRRTQPQPVQVEPSGRDRTGTYTITRKFPGGWTEDDMPKGTILQAESSPFTLGYYFIRNVDGKLLGSVSEMTLLYCCEET